MGVIVFTANHVTTQCWSPQSGSAQIPRRFVCVFLGCNTCSHISINISHLCTAWQSSYGCKGKPRCVLLFYLDCFISSCFWYLAEMISFIKCLIYSGGFCTLFCCRSTAYQFAVCAYFQIFVITVTLAAVDWCLKFFQQKILSRLLTVSPVVHKNSHGKMSYMMLSVTLTDHSIGLVLRSLA